MPPAPTESRVRLNALIASILHWIFIGKVRLIGIENIQRTCQEPRTLNLIVVSNHSHGHADFFGYLQLAASISDRPCRAMAHQEVFKSLFGWGAKIALACGCFPVDLEAPRAVIEIAIQALRPGQVVVICPEGLSNLDGRLGPFRTGCIRLARKAESITGFPTYVVPSYSIYHKRPGNWIRIFPYRLQYLLVTVLFPLYRGGRTTVFGKAFPVSDLPENVKLATIELRSRVAVLEPIIQPRQTKYTKQCSLS